MSWKRLPPAEELFVMLPHRFIDAVMRGELSERQARLCLYIVRHASQEKALAKLSLAQIDGGVDWQESDDTLLRELKTLRPAWIDFGSKQGQRAPYAIRLTGLKVLREGDELPLTELGPETPSSARPPHDLRNIAAQGPPLAEVAEVVESSKQSGEEPQQEPPQTSLDSPLNSYLYEGSEVKAAGEEKLDHVVGKTTAELASVDQGGRQGLLDDLQALVDAGVGEWIEDDTEGKR
jgi:hypothetical protein